jgi:hypothetical protein
LDGACTHSGIDPEDFSPTDFLISLVRQQKQQRLSSLQLGFYYKTKVVGGMGS